MRSTGCGWTDITEHPAADGKLYCAAVMDACCRRIIGWSIDTCQKTDLVIDALGMAILRRRPDGRETILHSDHGTQYTSWAFGKRIRDAGLLGSMGTVGDCPLTGQSLEIRRSATRWEVLRSLPGGDDGDTPVRHEQGGLPAAA